MNATASSNAAATPVTGKDTTVKESVEAVSVAKGDAVATLQAPAPAAVPASSPASNGPKKVAAKKPASPKARPATKAKSSGERMAALTPPAKEPPASQPAAKPASAGKKGKKGAVKAEKPAKPRKIKLVRDSYAMPEPEYQQIGALKKRLAAMGGDAKKSELLRAGIALLASLNDAELKVAVGRIERIKTGRPSK